MPVWFRVLTSLPVPRAPRPHRHRNRHDVVDKCSNNEDEAGDSDDAEEADEDFEGSADSADDPQASYDAFGGSGMDNGDMDDEDSQIPGALGDGGSGDDSSNEETASVMLASATLEEHDLDIFNTHDDDDDGKDHDNGLLPPASEVSNIIETTEERDIDILGTRDDNDLLPQVSEDSNVPETTETTHGADADGDDLSNSGMTILNSDNRDSNPRPGALPKVSQALKRDLRAGGHSNALLTPNSTVSFDLPLRQTRSITVQEDIDRPMHDTNKDSRAISLPLHATPAQGPGSQESIPRLAQEAAFPVQDHDAVMNDPEDNDHLSAHPTADQTSPITGAASALVDTGAQLEGPSSRRTTRSAERTAPPTDRPEDHQPRDGAADDHAPLSESPRGIKRAASQQPTSERSVTRPFLDASKESPDSPALQTAEQHQAPTSNGLGSSAKGRQTRAKMTRDSVHRACTAGQPCHHPIYGNFPVSNPSVKVYHNTLYGTYQLTVAEVEYILSRCTCYWAEFFGGMWEEWSRQGGALQCSSLPEMLLHQDFLKDRVHEAAFECCPRGQRVVISLLDDDNDDS